MKSNGQEVSFYFYVIPFLWSRFFILSMYHRERILETSTLSCNEEEEEITKPPKR